MPIDLPSGDWTALLIGDQWPSYTSLEAMFASAGARQRSAQEFEQYAQLLAAIRGQSLASQEGLTAEDTRATFMVNENHARDIATSNSAKSKSYAAAHRAGSELRGALRELASEGNNRIDAVNKSKITLPEKIAQILEIITDIRTRAFGKAATCAGEIYSEIQKTLAAQGIDTPPRVFAASKGVKPAETVANDPAKLQEAIANKLQARQDSVSTTTPEATQSTNQGLDGGIRYRLEVGRFECVECLHR